MLADRHLASRRLAEFSVLALILVVAAAARLWFLDTGLPYAVGADEPQIVDKALRILHTGDWNPHIFDDPTLVIYLQAVVAILRFLWGALNGEWTSLDAFSIAAIYGAGRFVAAAIGVLTIWLIYRLGTELSSRRVALLAAAQLAVRPIHVRESHFVLTDVPMTALTTLAVWLSVRAARLGTGRAYAWAGAACGLAAAANYNGGIALVAALAAWLLHERTSPHRLRTLGALVAAAAVGFLAGAPYTLLDLPGFLNGFAAQFSRFAVPAIGSEPAWSQYFTHLSPPAQRWFVPVGALGIVILSLRSSTRIRWAPVVVFTLAYFYMLSSHSQVSARYALPLIPMLCLATSVVAVDAVRFAARFPQLARPAVQRALAAVAFFLLIYGPAAESIKWLDMQKRSDTRTLAADWLKTNTPRGTRVAVETSGPTYLDTTGFKVTATRVLLDRGVDWYRERADYLVISSSDLGSYGDYVGAGPTVFQVGPTPQRLGPPITIVRLSPP